MSTPTSDASPAAQQQSGGQHQLAATRSERLLQVVPRGHQARRPRGELRRPRLHGDQAPGLRHLGADAARPRPPLQGRPATSTRTSRCSSRRAFLEKEAEHVEGFAKEMRGRHAPPPRGRPRTAAWSSPTRELDEPLVIRPTSETIIGEHVRQVDPVLPRPAAADQPVGQRRPLGDAHAPVPAHRPSSSGRRATPPTPPPTRRARRPRRCSTSIATFAEEMMAMPVIAGEKTPDERFAGAGRHVLRSRP